MIFFNDTKEFFLYQKSYGNTTRKFFFYAKNKIQLAFRAYLVLQFKTLIGNILPGGVWGGGSLPNVRPPNVSTPFLPGHRHAEAREAATVRGRLLLA